MNIQISYKPNMSQSLICDCLRTKSIEYALNIIFHLDMIPSIKYNVL